MMGGYLGSSLSVLVLRLNMCWKCVRLTREEEILLTECWVETSENGQIRAERSEDSFWGQIMDDFNTATTQGYRTKHMLTGKWTRINGDCQKFNVIYKHLERKSGENEADHIEAAKITFAAQQPKERVSTRALLAYFKRSLQMGRAETH
nr:glutathione S-transferase T3-like [Tanacetum cinerariifolium]